MRLLLDTHVLVWAASDPGRLSRRCRDLIEDPDNDRLVSVASAYEIEFKRERDPQLARLPSDLDDLRPSLLFDWLWIDDGHAKRAGQLPRHHGDPWDRLLVAQALTERLAVVSIDRALANYGARVEW
jgi:PIN domain nuclease of toxin-antitoxin system